MPSKCFFLEKFNPLLDRLDIGILMVDRDLKIILINDWITQRLPPEKREAQSLLELLEGYDSAFLKKTVRETILYKNFRLLSQVFHAWIIPLKDNRFADGLMRQACLIAPYSCIEDGMELAVIQLRDLSDRVVQIERLQKTRKSLEKKVEERTSDLLAREKQYRRLVENIPGILYSFSDKSGNLYVSPKIKEILGFTPQDLKENPMLWHDSVLMEDRWKVDRAIEGISRDEDFDIQYRIQDHAGEIHWFQDRSIGIIKEKEEIIVEGLALDITEDIKLRRLLNQSRRLEALGELAAGIAHDFNNILQVILNSIYLTQSETGLSDKAREFLSTAKDCGSNAKKLIRKLLTFVSPEEAEAQPLNMAELARSTLKMMSSSIPNQIKVIFQIDENNLWITGDETQLSQVIVNLCSNAVYSMKKKGSELTISLKKTVLSPDRANALGILDGPYVKLTVQDNGDGIPEELQKKVFDPFFTTKSKVHGTGLGLSVVYGIIKNHKGGIGFESVSGIGTCFWVYLPIELNA
ncbi:MAG: ATP-binding protein [Deltaproteobacteria bacterium]|nr:ATP-binding protein [Deltaproteobacteria bacterium]